MSNMKVSTTTNKSGLRPVGRAVLLEPYEPEIEASIIYIPPTARERGMMVEERGIVIAIGPEAWPDEKEPRARVGDKVMVSKWAGSIVSGPLDGRKYRMVNGDDVYCVVEAETAAQESAA
jgi:co-chaperonin GroES (HSP10)